MSSLLDTQFTFSRKLGLLIPYIYEKGYCISLGDAWAKTGHRANSLHYDRLAIDLNLFKDKVWLTKTSDHEPIGLFWESIGGYWGGRFGDGNHYSMEYRGRK